MCSRVRDRSQRRGRRSHVVQIRMNDHHNRDPGPAPLPRDCDLHSYDCAGGDSARRSSAPQGRVLENL